MYSSGCVSGRDGCFIRVVPARSGSGIPVAVGGIVGSAQPNVVMAERSARAAGLRYSSGDKPGISRHRRGKSFTFKDAQGRVIRAPKTLARLRALVLPPAWTNVCIATDPRAHLQATGRDAAGRKQYRYHADWSAERDSTKYHRMLAFAEVLPAIRRRTRRDMMGPACCRSRVLATVVELLGRRSEERRVGKGGGGRRRLGVEASRRRQGE